jgi:aryl-alcohol dehydrogenase
MKITAAVLREQAQPFTLEELDLEDPRADEVLVRIVGVGICHTDLTVRDRPTTPRPAVLGHEGAGVIERVGKGVTQVQPGDHVVLSWGSCGACHHCQRGLPAYCLKRSAYTMACTRLDGSTCLRRHGEVVHSHFFGQSSFASHALASERTVIKVDPDLPLALLGPLGCGVQTGAGAVLNTLRPRVGSSLAVFGVGPVGMSAIMAAAISGCTTIIAVDVKPNRLELALAFGATHTINADDTDPVAAIRQLTDGGADYTLDTSGVPAVLRQAVDSLTRLGVCGLIGLAGPGAEVRLEMSQLLQGRILRGIIQGDSVPNLFIPQLINLYRRGRFPFDRMVAYYPLEQINQAAADAVSGAVMKPVLRVG